MGNDEVGANRRRARPAPPPEAPPGQLTAGRLPGRTAHTAAEPGGAGGMAASGEITAAMLARTFPQWRVVTWSGGTMALRPGTREPDGPRSLIRHVLAAPDLSALAEKLCLQDYLDHLGPAELDWLYLHMALPLAQDGPVKAEGEPGGLYREIPVA